MANEIARAKAILDNLSENDLTTEQIKSVAEWYTNLEGQGATNQGIAEEFLKVMGRHIRATVRRNAKLAKKNEIAATAAEAASNAEATVPAGTPNG